MGVGFVLFQLNVAAQSCTSSLSGRVIDEHDKSALAYATIYLKENDKSALADSLGNYIIPHLCDGKYTLVCAHIGCETITQTIEIKGSTILNLYPEHHAYELGMAEVVVTKNQDPVAPIQHISILDLDRSAGQTLGEITTRVVGLTTLNTGNNISKPVIRGLHSNRVLIINNGVRQEGQQWGNEHAPEIDPFVAGDIEVIKGANSIRYGSDAIGGVIVLNPKSLRQDTGVGGEVNVVGFSNGRQGTVSAMLEVKPAKLSGFNWRIQGTAKRGGNVKTADYFVKNTGVSEYNFSWQSRYAFKNAIGEVFYSQFNTKIGIYSGAHIGNLTDLQRAFDSPGPLDSAGFSYTIGRPSQQINHELFKASLKFFLRGRNSLHVNFARQFNTRLEYDKHKPLNDSLAALDLPALQFNITTHTAEMMWKHFYKGFLQGSAGISVMNQGNTYQGRFFIPNFKKNTAGVFVIEQFKMMPNKLVFELGLRYDFIQQQVFMYEGKILVEPAFHYQGMAGNFAVKYTPTKQLSINYTFGTAWRPPHINELFSNGLHHGAAAFEIGDSTLTPERVLSNAFTFEFQTSNWFVAVEPYYNAFQNFIYLQPQLPPRLTIRGAFPTFYYKQAPVVMRGVDIHVSRSLVAGFEWVTKASILRANNSKTKEYIVMMPADRVENKLEWKREKWKKLNDISAGLAVQTVMKQWRVPANSDFVAPPKSYNLVNMTVGCSFQLKNQKLNVNVGIQNLLNTAYRDYLNRFRYYIDNPGRNVSIALKYQF